MPPLDPNSVTVIPPRIEPKPFPGGVPLPPRGVRPEQQIDATAQTMGINADENARAAERLRLAQEQARREAEEAEAKKAKRAATGGIDTTESESTAAFLTSSLGGHVNAIKRLQQENPDAMQPGWQEKVGGLFGDDAKAWATPDGVQSARTNLNNRYSQAIQDILTLGTGAAYTKEQIESYTRDYSPQIFDTPEVLKEKALMLQEKLIAAKLKTGAAGGLVDEAINQMKQVYGTAGSGDIGTYSEVAPLEKSSTADSERVPAEAQAAWEKWLETVPRGQLTEEMVRQKYQELGIGAPAANPMFIEGFNKGYPVNTQIPPIERKMGALEAGFSDAAGSTAGVAAGNFANAMGMGIPELLVGQEGREKFHQSNAENLGASLTGDILGSISPGIALERLAGKAGMGLLGREVASNTALGGVRGYNAADEGDGLGDTAMGAGFGVVGSLGARGVMSGIRGSAGMQDDIARLGSEEITIPGERGQLPLDEITPARFRGLTDEQLKAEADKAWGDLDTWRQHEKLGNQLNARREAIEKNISSRARENSSKQIEFFRNNRKFGMTPEQEEAVWKQAAEAFPTDVNKLRTHPDFAQDLRNLRTASPDIESPELLMERVSRLDDYLRTPNDPTVVKVPGTDLTTMQRVGGGRAEETLQGLPIVSGARSKAQASWNNRNVNRALAEVGETLPEGVKSGLDANAHLYKVLDSKYNELKPALVGKFDETFLKATAGLGKTGRRSLKHQELWTQLQNMVDEAGGVYDGNKFTDMDRRLRGLSEEWLAKDAGVIENASAFHEMGRVAEKLRQNLRAQAGRNTPRVAVKLKALDKAWARKVRIDRASAKALANDGVYSPGQYTQALKELDPSKNKAQSARGAGFEMDNARAASSVMGSKQIPENVNLWQTLATPSALGLVGMKAPIVPLAAATGAVMGYTPGLKRLTQAMTSAKRPKVMDNSISKQTLAQALRSWGMSEDEVERAMGN